MMDTPAGPDPDINIVGEETGVEIRDALLAFRMEMRAMHQHLAMELDEMRKIGRRSGASSGGWSGSISLGPLPCSPRRHMDFAGYEP
jgi:hypothetical protein